jgi:hypothetical protein
VGGLIAEAADFVEEPRRVPRDSLAIFQAVQEIELTLANIGASLVSVATLGASTSPNGRSVIRIVVASSWKSRSPALPVEQACLRRMVVVNHREKTDAEPSPIRS